MIHRVLSRLAAVATAAAMTTVVAVLGSSIAAAEQPAEVRVAPEGEPGDTLVVRGTVLAADGRTPVTAEIYVYQTDLTGNYSADGQQNRDDSRLQATFQTDAGGRYRFRTIRPGHYPGSRVPAHIHYVVTPSGGEAERHDLFFADDPVLPKSRREAAGERFGSVQAVERDADGVQWVVRDIQLEQ